jgi:phage repressor protein C with HTH and peptisase S24 domain
MLSEWLRRALESSKTSQAALARQLTATLGRSIDRAAVNKMVNGGRSIAADELKVIEQITGYESPSALTVPVRGFVGAGQLVEAVDNGEAEHVDAPSEAKPETVAVIVRGDSMFPAFEDGSILYYSKNLPPEHMINRRCVVQVSDGRIYVKTLRRGASDGLWTLSSLNAPDIEDVPVDWAAPIDWVKPRN